MPDRLKCNVLCLLIASTFAFPAAALMREGWSAARMIGTDVRGRNGQAIGQVSDVLVDRGGSVQAIVVRVSDLLEIADPHIRVPWRDVRIGPEMDWVHVPLREVERGTYSLYGQAPPGEKANTGGDIWRIKELVGDFVSLGDVPRYGLITDVIFDRRGRATQVIVSRTAGPWGAAGRYRYPYAEFDPTAYVQRLPFRAAEVPATDERNAVDVRAPRCN